ncbi:MAG: uroporphyrinogen decarboxylase family protein [Anaerolineae bacterium]|nr:uroporphyrinogen decarboxylase family protein [Anaerolineae bacterium]
MATSREIVAQTLAFASPERIAHSFEPSDFVWAGTSAKTFATDWAKDELGKWFRFDEWGNRWGRLEDTSKGEVVQGVLPSIDELERLQVPDFSNPADYEIVRQIRKEHPDHWLIGGLPGFTFNVARKILRIDQYLLELAANPERIARLNDKLDQAIADMIINYAKAGVDAVMFPEDWGTQLNTFISPRMWKREFFPRFERFCDLAHDNGTKVFMHSCGKITAIMPALIEAGIDLFQFDQPDLHGIDILAKYQDDHQVTFWCPVDIQKVLQTRDEATIRAKAKEMIDKLWHRPGGGFIAGYYDDNASIGLDPKWQAIACDEFLKIGGG